MMNKCSGIENVFLDGNSAIEFNTSNRIVFYSKRPPFVPLDVSSG